MAYSSRILVVKNMTMKRFTHFPAILLVFIALVFGSCTSVDKLVENGNYEETIRLAQKKLSGKQKKNPRYVAALEEAVNKSIHRDMELAERMTESGTPDWVRIHGIYEKIDRRQRALQPLLPLIDKNGREAEFRFVPVESLIASASDRAADQSYNEGLIALDAGRAGDKQAARNAFQDFETVDRYRANYRDTRELREEARELGKVFIQVSMVNESGGYLPRGFENELLRPDAYNMDTQWRFYDFAPRPGFDYDYDARIVIRDIQVSPERITERIYTDEREITDGTEYVLDVDGNVAKDTLGNDITRPRRVIIRANVIEALQRKSALVSGSLVLWDIRNDRIVEEESLTAEAIFSNYASTYRGDRRALSRDTRRYISNRTRQFPSDEDLILDAADVLKPRLQDLLATSYQTK